MEDELHKRVVGQEQAIKAVSLGFQGNNDESSNY